MGENEEDQAYTALFISFSQQAERWLGRILILLVIALCLFQTALLIPEFRQMLSSAEKFEGVPVHKPDKR